MTDCFLPGPSPFLDKCSTSSRRPASEAGLPPDAELAHGLRTIDGMTTSKFKNTAREDIFRLMQLDVSNEWVGSQLLGRPLG